MYHEMGIPQFFSCIDSAALANLVSLAIKTTALFGITYVCKSFFSKLNLTKNDFRSTISEENLKATLKIASSTTLKANIDDIIANI